MKKFLFSFLLVFLGQCIYGIDISRIENIKEFVTSIKKEKLIGEKKIKNKKEYVEYNLQQNKEGQISGTYSKVDKKDNSAVSLVIKDDKVQGFTIVDKEDGIDSTMKRTLPNSYNDSLFTMQFDVLSLSMELKGGKLTGKYSMSIENAYKIEGRLRDGVLEGTQTVYCPNGEKATMEKLYDGKLRISVYDENGKLIDQSIDTTGEIEKDMEAKFKAIYDMIM